MGFREIAAQSARAIIEADGSSVTLTASGGASYSLVGIVHASGTHLDRNGLMVEGDYRAVSISTLALAEAGITDPQSLKSSGWTLATTDVLGAAISGEVDLVLNDATRGVVDVTVKE